MDSLEPAVWRDLLLFAPLAVVTNTGLPLPFEPVLLYFAAPYPLRWASVFVLGGSLCAGIAGILDVWMMGLLRGFVPAAWISRLPACRGGWFYAWTAVLAASPLPLTLVRVAILRARPDPLLYGLAVTLGRVPRFLATLYVWQALAPPPQLNVLLLVAGLLLPLCASRPRRRQDAAWKSLGTR